MEDKHARFKRVITKRFDIIYDTMRLIDNIIVNKNHVYEHSENEVNNLLDTIQKKLDESRDLLNNKGVRFKIWLHYQ